jgi:AGZA family xanthine/uracil permease-like MFS transporter
MIDRRLWRAGCLLMIAGGLTLLGIMHSPIPGSPMFFPWRLDASTARLVWPFAAGYWGAAAVLLVWGVWLRAQGIGPIDDATDGAHAA